MVGLGMAGPMASNPQISREVFVFIFLTSRVSHGVTTGVGDILRLPYESAWFRQRLSGQ